MTRSSHTSPAATTAKRWLVVVGIGEDGLAGLGDAALSAIETAEHVFGGGRHLALAASRIRGVAHPWPSPFDAGMAEIRALRGRAVCVLASGDPFLHGVGATLARHIAADEMEAYPSPSAFSVAAARLGWALQDVETVSLHGKPVELIRPLLHPGRRVLALTSDGDSPNEIAALLADDGFYATRMTVLEALGGRDERITRHVAGDFAPQAFNPLNLVALEIEAAGDARVLPRAPGLADELFLHDGQITKREIRALTLSALAPRRDEMLWDIGAGSGSVSIEWMLADPSTRAVAVERDAARAARVRDNARRLGVPALGVVEGEAPAALAELPPPDAIFVGGGGSQPGVMDAAIAALRPGGRMVANAVTLEMEAVLLALHAARGGEVLRVSVSRAAPVGGMTGWRAAMPVTQWIWRRP